MNIQTKVIFAQLALATFWSVICVRVALKKSEEFDSRPILAIALLALLQFATLMLIHDLGKTWVD